MVWALALVKQVRAGWFTAGRNCSQGDSAVSSHKVWAGWVTGCTACGLTVSKGLVVWVSTDLSALWPGRAKLTFCNALLIHFMNRPTVACTAHSAGLLDMHVTDVPGLHSNHGP